jgi:hypothetical protein
VARKAPEEQRCRHHGPGGFAPPRAHGIREPEPAELERPRDPRHDGGEQRDRDLRLAPLRDHHREAAHDRPPEAAQHEADRHPHENREPQPRQQQPAQAEPEQRTHDGAEDRRGDEEDAIVSATKPLDEGDCQERRAASNDRQVAGPAARRAEGLLRRGHVDTVYRRRCR